MPTSPLITAALARWHECVVSGDRAALSELLAEEIIFRSPFLWKPKVGKELALIVLGAAAQVFENFTYQREMTDGVSWTLEFSARVGEFSLKGVDIVRFNAAGKIEELEVMVRPAKGLHALAEAMGRQMAAQGQYEQFING